MSKNNEETRIAIRLVEKNPIVCRDIFCKTKCNKNDTPLINFKLKKIILYQKAKGDKPLGIRHLVFLTLAKAVVGRQNFDQ